MMDSYLKSIEIGPFDRTAPSTRWNSPPRSVASTTEAGSYESPQKKSVKFGGTIKEDDTIKIRLRHVHKAAEGKLRYTDINPAHREKIVTLSDIQSMNRGADSSDSFDSTPYGSEAPKDCSEEYGSASSGGESYFDQDDLSEPRETCEVRDSAVQPNRGKTSMLPRSVKKDVDWKSAQIFHHSRVKVRRTDVVSGNKILRKHDQEYQAHKKVLETNS